MNRFKKCHTLIVAAFLAIVSTTSCSTGSEDYNILDYGAKSDTETLNTAAVQAAIDACAVTGGRVVVPAGDFQIGTIKLKSGVELHVERGGQLLGSTSIEDYDRTIIGAIEAPAFDEVLVYGEGLENIKITGEGVINGRGLQDHFPIGPRENYGDRPMLIRLINCRNIELQDITFRDAASWCCHLVDCDDIVARGVTIDSHVNRNNDGFDIDGCKRVLIEDCNVRSGDDGICPKSTTERICEDIVVRNCRVESNTSAFKLGTSSRGGFRNVRVSDCDFSDSRMGAIKLLSVDGGIMEDIIISDIYMENVEGPIFIRLGSRGRDYRFPTEQIQGKDVVNEGVPTGSARNITIRNVKAIVNTTDTSRAGIMISGIPGHAVENVLLQNIEVSYPGGVKAGEFKAVVDEDVARYPEQFFFGTLPTWGAYVRHAKDVTFDNVQLSVRAEDVREKMMTISVENFVEI